MLEAHYLEKVPNDQVKLKKSATLFSTFQIERVYQGGYLSAQEEIREHFFLFSSSQGLTNKQIAAIRRLSENEALPDDKSF